MTAATAMAKLLHGFHPAYVIIDEGPQLAEHATVTVLSRFYEMTCKVTLVGDPNQNGVFSASDNEFTRTIQRSLMIRLMNTGMPFTLFTLR